MAAAAQAFVKGIGKPDPATPCGLQFESKLMGKLWSALHAEIGAGWYLNRFLFLFGPDLESLDRCLEAWSFIVPASEDRRILGYNAYGSMLILENASQPGADQVHVLDTLNVRYWSDANMTFGTLIGSWLAERRIPHFFDTTAYELWCKGLKRPLGDREILGIKIPLPLGGTMKYDNFQPEGLRRVF